MISRNAAFAAVLILASSLVATAGIETALRVLDIGYGQQPLNSDPVFHHVHPSSYRLMMHDPKREVEEYGGHHIYYDENGLSADPDGATPKRGDCRIAFLGDSITEAKHVHYKDSFPGLVDAATNCTVRNYGVRSYSPTFYYLQWKHLIRDWKPNLVVVQLHANDIAGDEEYLAQAEFDTDGNPVAVPGPPEGWFFKTLRSSYTARLARRAQLKAKYKWRHWGRPKNIVGGTVERNPDISEASSKLVLQLSQAVEESGSAFLLFVVPSKYRLRNLDMDHTGLPEFAEKWEAWSRQRGVNYVDLIQPYKETVLSGKQVFWTLDVHLNENGHAATAGAIQRTGLVPNDDAHL